MLCSSVKRKNLQQKRHDYLMLIPNFSVIKKVKIDFHNPGSGGRDGEAVRKRFKYIIRQTPCLRDLGSVSEAGC